MNSLLMFIPLATCLLVALGGFACVILAAVGLRKARAA
jgi:hypothetical protein